MEEHEVSTFLSGRHILQDRKKVKIERDRAKAFLHYLQEKSQGEEYKVELKGEYVVFSLSIPV